MNKKKLRSNLKIIQKNNTTEGHNYIQPVGSIYVHITNEVK